MDSKSSIHHDAENTDGAIRMQQAVVRRLTDQALVESGTRMWESSSTSKAIIIQRPAIVPSEEEVYLVVDLTGDDAKSVAFTYLFPYEEGDSFVVLALEQAQAVIRIGRIAASKQQLVFLKWTATIAGYTFKTWEGVARLYPTLFTSVDEA